MHKINGGVAHAWLCDSLGHLNSRHYVAMFDDAAILLLTRVCELAFGDRQPAYAGWADVRNEIDFVHEVRVGSSVDIFSTISRVGDKSLTIDSHMCGTGAKVHARFKAVIVRFDLSARTSMRITDELRAKALLFSPAEVATHA